jgi:hypothetical protein
VKTILAVLLSLMFVACNSPESENLKQENAALKTQLESVTKERDALKVQLDGIKAVLENAGGTTAATTPDSSAATPATPDSSAKAGSDMNTPNTNPDSSASATPDSGNATGSASPSAATPSAVPPSAVPPSTDSSPVAPNSGSSSSNTPGSATESSATESSATETYAKEVLETAQKYNAETQQTPPTDCSSGYTAGSHVVPSSDAVQSCRVDKANGGFKITLKDANGAISTYPNP